MTDWKAIEEGLQKPLTDAEIEWKPQRFSLPRGVRDAEEGKSFDNGSALMLAYPTARCIQQRLDDVVGCGNWRPHFLRWGQKGVLCGLSIREPGTKDWVTKWDGADETDIEPTKGGLSSSEKRAAVQWGIGRDLYDLPDTWVKAWVKVTGKDKWGRPKLTGKPDRNDKPRLPAGFPGSATTTRPPVSPSKPSEPTPAPSDDFLPPAPPEGSQEALENAKLISPHDQLAEEISQMQDMDSLNAIGPRITNFGAQGILSEQEKASLRDLWRERQATIAEKQA